MVHFFISVAGTYLPLPRPLRVHPDPGPRKIENFVGGFPAKGILCRDDNRHRSPLGSRGARHGGVSPGSRLLMLSTDGGHIL